ncbi:MAG: Ig-like domain-containing protein [Porticoccaceae bacterium]
MPTDILPFDYDTSERLCNDAERAGQLYLDINGCPLPFPYKGAGHQPQTKQLISCGGFQVEFEDQLLVTGHGFDHPTLGATRTSTVCQVFSDLAGIINLNGTTPDIFVGRSEYDGQPSSAAGIPGDGALAAASPLYINGTSGCYSGALHQHITTGVDPTPVQGVFDAVITHFDFGQRSLGGSTINWNDDWQQSAGSDLDLYTVTLHEVMHTLGFASLINASGGQRIPGIYSLFDKFLLQANGQKLISTACNSFTGSTPQLTSNTIQYFTPQSHNSVAQPTFSPPNFTSASSLSHFDYARSGMRYVMRASTIGGEDRQLMTPELYVLCDLGYDLLGFNCQNQAPIGVDDTNLIQNTTVPGGSLCIDVLQNDSDPDSGPSALQIDPASVSIINGGGSFTLNGSQICYTANPGFAGTVLLQYRPSDGNVSGDVTDVKVAVESDFCPSDPCNKVCNGGFEQGPPSNATLSYTSFGGPLGGGVSIVNNWSDVGMGSADLFVRGNQSIFNIPVNFASGNVPGGVFVFNAPTATNARYGGFSQREGVYAQLLSPLQPGNYVLSYYLYVTHFHNNGAPGAAPFRVFLDDQLVPSSLIAITAPSAHPSPNAVPIVNASLTETGAWVRYEQSFSVTTPGLEYLFMGWDPDSSSPQSLYIYMDGVSLRKPHSGVSISQTVSHSQPFPGQVIQYLLEVCNNTADPMMQIDVTDQLPMGVSYIAGMNNYPNHQLASLGANSCTTITIEARVDDTVAPGTSLRNCASITDGDVACQNPQATDYCADITVQAPQLGDYGINKTSAGGIWEVGEEVKYSIALSGNYSSFPVQVTDLLPAGFTFTNVNASWNCLPAPPQVGPVAIQCSYPGPLSQPPNLWIAARIDSVPSESNCADLLMNDANPVNNHSCAPVVITDPNDSTGSDWELGDPIVIGSVIDFSDTTFVDSDGPLVVDDSSVLDDSVITSQPSVSMMCSTGFELVMDECLPICNPPKTRKERRCEAKEGLLESVLKGVDISIGVGIGRHRSKDSTSVVDKEKRGQVFDL